MSPAASRAAQARKTQKRCGDSSRRFAVPPAKAFPRHRRKQNARKKIPRFRNFLLDKVLPARHNDVGNEDSWVVKKEVHESKLHRASKEGPLGGADFGTYGPGRLRLFT